MKLKILLILLLFGVLFGCQQDWLDNNETIVTTEVNALTLRMKSSYPKLKSKLTAAKSGSDLPCTVDLHLEVSYVTVGTGISQLDQSYYEAVHAQIVNALWVDFNQTAAYTSIQATKSAILIMCPVEIAAALNEGWFEKHRIGYVSGQWIPSIHNVRVTVQQFCSGYDPDNGGWTGEGNPDSGTPGSGGDGDPYVNSDLLISEFNEEKIVVSSDLPDCMGNILKSIQGITGTTIADMIQKFSGNVPGYDLVIMPTVTDLTISGYVDKDLYDDSGQLIIWMNINPDAVSNATDVAIATTLMHESIHAYLIAFYNNDPAAATQTYPELFDRYSEKKVFYNNIQHEFFATAFIADMALSLQKFTLKHNGFTYDSDFYNDMAWKGLTGTKAFMKLSDTKRKRIIDRIKAEQYKVENNGTVQRGQPAGC